MPHARLTHPSRPDLAFRQAQQDTDATEAVSNVAPLVGDDQPPLVHIETRNRTRSLTGRVTGPRRAANDPDTADWVQALANYVDRLQAHVNEFQGTGYTLVDDIRDESLNCIYHGAEWTLMPGVPAEIEFSVDVTVGRGTFGTETIQRRTPTVQSSMDYAATVGGEPLPGLRQFKSRRELSVQTNAVWGKDTAENNDVVAQEGPTQRWTFEGTHTGSETERASADADLRGLIGSQVTLQTRFPGYAVDGYVLNYDSDFETRHGERKHHFTLEFIEGKRA